MSDASEAEALDMSIRNARGSGDYRKLQRLYLEREAMQLRQFKASLARRAKAAK